MSDKSSKTWTLVLYMRPVHSGVSHFQAMRSCVTTVDLKSGITHEWMLRQAFNQFEREMVQSCVGYFVVAYAMAKNGTGEMVQFNVEHSDHPKRKRYRNVSKRTRRKHIKNRTTAESYANIQPRVLSAVGGISLGD